MLGQTHAVTQAAAANVHDDLEVLWGDRHPALGQLHALFHGQHISFAGGAVDKYTFQSVLGQHVGIGLNRPQVDISIGMERSERSIYQSDNFFHNILCLKS